MRENTLINIVIIADKNAFGLKKTLKSAKNQNFKNFNFIIIGKDNCKQELQKFFQNKNADFFCVQNSQKILSEITKRNSNSFIVFLKTGDTWNSGKIRKQLLALDNPKVGFSYHPVINKSKTIDPEYGEIRDINLSNIELISPSSIIINRKILEQVNTADFSNKLILEYLLLRILEKFPACFINRILAKTEDNLNKKYNKILVKEKIKEITKKFNLKIRESRKTVDFLTVFCQNKIKEKFVLKISRRGRKDVKTSIKKEAAISNFFTKNQKEENFCLEFVSSGISQPEWFLYKFLKGGALGSAYEIERKFLKESLIDNVLSNISILQENFDRIELRAGKKIDFNPDIREKIEHTRNMAFRSFKNSFSKNIKANLEFFEKEFPKTKLRLSHNDLHPGNIIINKNKIFFIDFSRAELNSPYFDFIVFILCGWKNPEWIKTSIKKLCEKFPNLKNSDSEERAILKLSLIEAAAKLTAHANPKNNSIKENLNAESAKKYFLEVFNKLDKIYL